MPELNDQFYDFVRKNENSNVQLLALSEASRPHPFPIRFALTQIECRRKTRTKLSFFLSSPRFLFPSVQCSEQSTHQAVAAYHARLAGSNQNILDMTGGLGIDSMACAFSHNQITTIELDADRAEVIEHNRSLLNLNSMTVVHGDSLQWIKQNADRHFDLLLVDPARRDDSDRRLYFLCDCLPDVVSNFELMSSCADRIMIKASPIVDLKNAVSELPQITAVHIVCVRGECKEVLLVADLRRLPDYTVRQLHVTDLDPNVTTGESGVPEYNVISSFQTELDAATQSGTAPVAETDDIAEGAYLYDPNAGIHKARCSAALCSRYPALKKLALNTDLYVSAKPLDDFPGREFRIRGIADKQQLRALKKSSGEVAVRNYPLTADELRKKLQMRSGGSNYLFAARVGTDARPVIIMADRC